MIDPVVLTETRGAILILTLNRPKDHNALSPEMSCLLADALRDFSKNAALRVCVLTGAGQGSFCSGGDLSLTLPLLTGDRTAETEFDHRFLNDPEVLAWSSLRGVALDKPVIAAINGHCLAGGFELMVGTDIRIASDTATFGLPEVRHGLIPFAGAPTRLPLSIPFSIAMELMLTGLSIKASAAAAVGLVNHVVPQDEVVPLALKIAERIAANGPVAVQTMKRLVRDASESAHTAGFALEDSARETVMSTRDAREGPRAFMEKRKPDFQGC